MTIHNDTLIIIFNSNNSDAHKKLKNTLKAPPHNFEQLMYQDTLPAKPSASQVAATVMEAHSQKQTGHSLAVSNQALVSDQNRAKSGQYIPDKHTLPSSKGDTPKHERVDSKKPDNPAFCQNDHTVNTSGSEFITTVANSFPVAAGDGLTISESVSEKTQPRIEAVKFSGIPGTTANHNSQSIDLTLDVTPAKPRQLSKLKKKEEAFENLMDQPPETKESDHKGPVANISQQKEEIHQRASEPTVAQPLNETVQTPEKPDTTIINPSQTADVTVTINSVHEGPSDAPKKNEGQLSENVIDQPPEALKPDHNLPTSTSSLEQKGLQKPLNQPEAVLTQKSSDGEHPLKASEKNSEHGQAIAKDRSPTKPEQNQPAIERENNVVSNATANDESGTRQTVPATSKPAEASELTVPSSGLVIKKLDRNISEPTIAGTTAPLPRMHPADTPTGFDKSKATPNGLSVAVPIGKHDGGISSKPEKDGPLVAVIEQKQTRTPHPEASVFNARQYALHKEIDKLQVQAPTAKEKSLTDDTPSRSNPLKSTEAVSGDVLLQKLFVSPNTAATQPEPSIDRFEQLSRLVETIRVATPRLAGQGEIHLTMKEGIWKDTTIQLKLSGNQLQIDVQTTADNTRLIAAHKDRLIQQLNEACPGLRPDVSITSSNDDLPNGRSRQQYLAEQEEDEL